MTDAEIMESFESLARIIEFRKRPLEPFTISMDSLMNAFKDHENYTKFKHNLEPLQKAKILWDSKN